MIKYIKNNKLLLMMFVFTLISFFVGIIFYQFINDEQKSIICNNIDLLIQNKLIKPKNLLFNNIITMTIIYLIGISVVGIIIILPIYLIRIFVISFELVNMIIYLKITNILLIVLYVLPNILNNIIYFIICYYAINYSLYLIKHLFFNKKYNMYRITKKYLYIYIILLIMIIISSLLELFLLSKLSFFKI